MYVHCTICHQLRFVNKSGDRNCVLTEFLYENLEYLDSDGYHGRFLLLFGRPGNPASLESHLIVRNHDTGKGAVGSQEEWQELRESDHCYFRFVLARKQFLDLTPAMYYIL